MCIYTIYVIYTTYAVYMYTYTCTHISQFPPKACWENYWGYTEFIGEFQVNGHSTLLCLLAYGIVYLAIYLGLSRLLPVRSIPLGRAVEPCPHGLPLPGQYTTQEPRSRPQLSSPGRGGPALCFLCWLSAPWASRDGGSGTPVFPACCPGVDLPSQWVCVGEGGPVYLAMLLQHGPRGYPGGFPVHGEMIEGDLPGAESPPWSFWNADLLALVGIWGELYLKCHRLTVYWDAVDFPE